MPEIEARIDMHPARALIAGEREAAMAVAGSRHRRDRHPDPRRDGRVQSLDFQRDIGKQPRVIPLLQRRIIAQAECCTADAVRIGEEIIDDEERGSIGANLAALGARRKRGKLG